MGKSKELACALEAFDTAINHIPDATKMIDNVYIKYWTQDTAESGRWVTTGLMARGAAETLLSDEYREAFPQGHIVEPPNSTTGVVEPVYANKNTIRWLLSRGNPSAEVTAILRKSTSEECSLPLYTAPPKQWVGLTDEEFKFIASKYSLPTQTGMEYFKDELETKLKEKNT